MQLKDTVAVVTGGASGLGEATVRRFIAGGAAVGIMDRPQSNGAKLAAELGDRALFVPADVTEADAVAQALDALVAKYGKLTAAVNCAGVGTAGRVLNKQGQPHALDVFEMVIKVNLVGTFNVMRLAAERMFKNTPNENGEKGIVINTASIAAFDGQVGQVAYAASKGGIVGMTLPVARDLAQHGIRCCVIAPGTFATPMLAMVSDEFKKQLEAQIPFPSRLGNPAEYGDLAAYIVSNPYLNGEVIRIDGALRMPPR
jgi:NAD(P)-dependent dehydrogenase (short-subunit alcohol dehydrogenase family)